MNLKKIVKVFTSKFVGTEPSFYKKRIYRTAVSQRLRNTGIGNGLGSDWFLENVTLANRVTGTCRTAKWEGE